MPTWLQANSVTVLKTLNGWAIAPAPNTAIEQCVVFETWDALAAYLSVNFAKVPG